MTDQIPDTGALAPPPAMLEYAPTATPDGVRIEPRDSGLLITLTATRRRLLRALTMMAALVGVAIVGGYLWFSADNRTEFVRLFAGIGLVLAAVGGAVTLGRRLLEIAFPVTIEVTDRQVVYTRRNGDQLGRHEWSRASIAGLQLRSAGRNEALQREASLELWFYDGQGCRLHRGPEAQVGAAADALCDRLGLPRPPGPRSTFEVRGPSRRVRVAYAPALYQITFRTPAVNGLTACLLPLAIAIAGVVKWLLFQHRRDSGIVAPAGFGWSVARVAAAALSVWVFAVGTVDRFRRKKSLTISGGRLILSEQSPFSPLQEQWACAQVRGFDVCDEPGGRAKLIMRLPDGRWVDVITGEGRRDLDWVCHMLWQVMVSWCEGNDTGKDDRGVVAASSGVNPAEPSPQPVGGQASVPLASPSGREEEQRAPGTRGT